MNTQQHTSIGLFLVLAFAAIVSPASAGGTDNGPVPLHAAPASALTGGATAECELSVAVKGTAVPGAMRWDITYRSEYGTNACNVVMDYPVMTYHNGVVLDPSFTFNFNPQGFDPDYRFISESAPTRGTCAAVTNDARFVDRPSYTSCAATLAPGQSVGVTVMTSGLHSPPYRYCFMAGVGSLHPTVTTADGVTIGHLMPENTLANNIGADCIDVYKDATKLEGVIIEALPLETFADPHWKSFDVIGGDYGAVPSASVTKDFALPEGFHYAYADGEGWHCESALNGSVARCARTSPYSGVFPKLFVVITSS